MKEQFKYYSLKSILSKNALYNVIFGERSNGKTFSVYEYAIKKYAETEEQLAIIRRYDMDFKKAATFFDAINKKGIVAKYTKGEWTHVYYRGSRWYFCRYEDDERIIKEKPFAYRFTLSGMEHDKSTSYPDITTILFDEFLSRTGYLNDEFMLFMNVLSTIIRDRKNVKIFICGNTVNKYCPYFKEMGLKHVPQMKQGDIDVYQYGESGLTVAVEYAPTDKKGKASDVYFAFDNPKLSMVTRGQWEIDVYPHCPCKYKPKEILFRYYIIFDDNILECEIVLHDDLMFTFIHRKTGEIKYPESDIVYTPEFSSRPNYKRKITKPISDIEKKIAKFYVTDKVFYADNEVGEIVRNYLMWCGKNV